MSDHPDLPKDFGKLSPGMEGSIIAKDQKFDRMKDALEEIACYHVAQDPLWWQQKARDALDKHDD